VRTEDSNVPLTLIEIELLRAALAYCDKKIRTERLEGLSDNIRVLRNKLLAVG
jgi:hypothetical protein